MSHPEFYLNAHESQYQAGASARTRAQGCTWTSGANGADAATGGRVDPEPDRVLAQVPPSEETNPQTPGWSLGDLSRAMARLSVPFVNRTNQGWGAVRAAHDSGLYLVLQGDSDVFSSATCSGDFDGDHAIGVHPDESSHGWWRIDDPICPGARYATESILRAYAEKFNPRISFGVFPNAVPKIEQPHVVLSAPTPSERNVMVTYANQVVTGRTMTLAKGQPLFKHPGGPRVTAMSVTGAVGHIGLAGVGWRAVKVVTKVPYRDKVARPTVLYVPASAGPVT